MFTLRQFCLTAARLLMVGDVVVIVLLGEIVEDVSRRTLLLLLPQSGLFSKDAIVDEGWSRSRRGLGECVHWVLFSVDRIEPYFVPLLEERFATALSQEQTWCRSCLRPQSNIVTQANVTSSRRICKPDHGKPQYGRALTAGSGEFKMRAKGEPTSKTASK